MKGNFKHKAFNIDFFKTTVTPKLTPDMYSVDKSHSSHKELTAVDWLGHLTVSC